MVFAHRLVKESLEKAATRINRMDLKDFFG
jgi:hypothetical protein